MGNWAETVRQKAEAAHGTGYIEADPVILNDTQYRDTMDLGGELDHALTDVTALIDHLRNAEQQAADSARETARGPLRSGQWRKFPIYR